MASLEIVVLVVVLIPDQAPHRGAHGLEDAGIDVALMREVLAVESVPCLHQPFVDLCPNERHQAAGPAHRELTHACMAVPALVRKIFLDERPLPVIACFLPIPDANQAAWLLQVFGFQAPELISLVCKSRYFHSCRRCHTVGGT